MFSRAIRDRLPWLTVPQTKNADRETVVSAYTESLQLLNRFRDDVQNVVRQACQANLEFRQEAGSTHVEARDATLKEKLDKMMSAATAEWDSAMSIASAKLLSQAPEIYTPRLQESLTGEVAKFTKQFFAMLARLVDQELCGLVEWLPNHCCRYHFFRHVVVQGAAETSEFSTWHDDDDEFIPFTRTQRTTTSHTVPHKIRLARHQHDLINAIRTSIENSSVVMPLQVQRLIEAIPEWLYPFVEVIDGQIVRERIAERDIAVADWSRVEVRDVPTIDFDPAVIIGPFVLSGWGAVEIREEEKRRRGFVNGSHESVQPWQARAFAVMATVLSGVCMWLSFRWLCGQGGLLFVLMAGATGIASTWQASFAVATLRKSPSATKFANSLAVAATAMLFVGVWVLARTFFPMSFVTPVVLIFVAYVSCCLAHHYR